MLTVQERQSLNEMENPTVKYTTLSIEKKRLKKDILSTSLRSVKNAATTLTIAFMDSALYVELNDIPSI